MLKKMCLLLALLILCVCVSKVAEEKVPLRQPKQISVEELDRIKKIFAGEDGVEISQEKSPSEEESAILPEEKEMPKCEYPLTYTADDGTEYIIMRLHPINTEGMWLMLDFMENLKFEYNLESSPTLFKFVKENGKLKLIGFADAEWDENAPPPKEFDGLDESDFYGNEYNSGEYCSEAVAFLCDEDAIRRCFEKNGINNIKDMFVIYDRRGYIIAAVTDSTCYYMTVPIVSEKYGDFVFQKIYTKNEFKKVYGPCQAKVFVDDKEVEFSLAYLQAGRGNGMENYFLELDVIRLGKVLGVWCEYDEKANILKFGDFIFGKNDLQEANTDYEGEIFYQAVMINSDSTPDKRENIGYITERDGKPLGSLNLIEWLAKHYGYRMDVSFENNSVHFYSYSNDVDKKYFFVDNLFVGMHENGKFISREECENVIGEFLSQEWFDLYTSREFIDRSREARMPTAPGLDSMLDEEADRLLGEFSLSAKSDEIKVFKLPVTLSDAAYNIQHPDYNGYIDFGWGTLATNANHNPVLSTYFCNRADENDTEIISRELEKNGIPKALVHKHDFVYGNHTYGGDLDGNGTIERVIIANSPKDKMIPDVNSGNYTMVLVKWQDKVECIYKEIDRYGYDARVEQDKEILNAKHLVRDTELCGIFDLDGDGKFEICIKSSGFGTAIYRVFSLDSEGEYTQVLESKCGH